MIINKLTMITFVINEWYLKFYYQHIVNKTMMIKFYLFKFES